MEKASPSTAILQRASARIADVLFHDICCSNRERDGSSCRRTSGEVQPVGSPAQLW